MSMYMTKTVNSNKNDYYYSKDSYKIKKQYPASLHLKKSVSEEKDKLIQELREEIEDLKDQIRLLQAINEE